MRNTVIDLFGPRHKGRRTTMRTSPVSLETVGARKALCAFKRTINMQDQNQALTALIRSMKRNLQAEHGIEISHAALRASYLKAQGENPFAFAAKKTQEAGVEIPSTTTKLKLSCFANLFLAHDELGCLERLAIDEQGRYQLPAEYRFNGAALNWQSAKIPRIKKYGLPAYLQNPQEFYLTHFGLGIDPSYSSKYEDLGDDSGDRCDVNIAMSSAEQCRMIEAVLEHNPEFKTLVATWVSRRYRAADFNAATLRCKADWVAAYLEQDPAQNEMPVIFEWVYPDEDAYSVEGWVNVDTGLIHVTSEVPDDVSDSVVRCRIWISEDASAPVVNEGLDYYAQAWNQGGKGGFEVDPDDLVALRNQVRALKKASR